MEDLKTCECGKEMKLLGSPLHLKSKGHLEGVAAKEEVNVTNHLPATEDVTSSTTAPSTNGVVPLDPGLQGALDIGKRTDMDDKQKAQLIAKTVRLFFAQMGWPNTEHPGTVADFLTEHKVLILTPSRPPRGVTTTRATNDPAMGSNDPALAVKE